MAYESVCRVWFVLFFAFVQQVGESESRSLFGDPAPSFVFVFPAYVIRFLVVDFLCLWLTLGRAEPWGRVVVRCNNVPGAQQHA